MRTLADISADRAGIKAKITEIKSQSTEIADRATEQNRSLTEGEGERVDRLVRGLERAIDTEAELVAEYKDALSAGVESGKYGLESEPTPADATRTRDPRWTTRSQYESAALRAVERNGLTGESADRLDRLIRDHEGDPAGFGPRYIAAVANPAYSRAFGRILRSPQMAPYEMSPEEATSVREVRQADSQRALSLTGASGGFAVPFDLDPTLLNTSNGATNPVREFARVVTIAHDEWRGVSSGAITAAYAAEATETTDNAPTLAQPTISTEKAQAFIPFSIEVGMDWATMQQDLSVLLADAKDTLEATKFVTGTGTNEPAGYITGFTTTVNATAGGVFDLEDLYRLSSELPARYQGRGTFAASMAIYNKIRQFDTAGGAGIWADSLTVGTPGRLLGRPAYTVSTMSTVTTTGALFLAYADFSRFVIVDRIGLQVELVSHLVGTNHRPTGQRGLYCYFRNSSKVVDSNAGRVLIGLA